MPLLPPRLPPWPPPWLGFIGRRWPPPPPERWPPPRPPPKPGEELPRMGAGPFVYIFEAYVQELGDHLKPTARALAAKIVSGEAASVPAWGYKLLARFPDQSLAALTPGLKDQQLAMRERVAVYGGTVQAGHLDRGGFGVHASLPFEAGERALP